MKEIEKGKTDQRKKTRIQMKVARAEDQEARKKWVKQQAICHTQGNDQEDEVDPAVIVAARAAWKKQRKMMGPYWSSVGEPADVTPKHTKEYLIQTVP